MAAMFAYIVPYINRDREGVADLLPANFTEQTLSGYPFFGGVLVLILAVMAIGSDYGWNVTKTLLTQRAGRLEVFGGKVVALAIWLIPFVIVPFGISLASSVLIAELESGSAALPDGSLIGKSLLAAWLVLAVWAMLGVLLATLSRGTSLAIGIGILYGLVFEGLLGAVLDGVDSLSPLMEGFIRTNAYSLVRPLGVFSEATRDNGPGSFSGPYVSGMQALLVLGIYTIAFAAIAGGIFRRRDVT
jgi:ABC-type transport system involved in multi-copper enzyme maturation permease subunit